ncbi:MAG: hypothetical protein INR73_13190 [Williamsia sp.]|nr:hypothetical protein [Williamsia sp.]
MRRISAILFLSLLLLTKTELCQLMKLPVLMEHFREHGEFYKDFSFLRFMREHYFNDDTKDPDYARDMQLPFKTNAGALLICNSHLITIPFHITLPTVPPAQPLLYHPHFHPSWIPAAHYNDIFQPPRCC